MEYTEPQEQHLLLDLEDTYVRASHGKRLANYLLDIFAFFILLFLLLLLWEMLSPGSLDTFNEDNSNTFMDRIIYTLLYAVFMFAQEAIFKGRSVGKFITGTRAVNLDGSTISSKTAMLRALSRAVPFCAFSALGSPCNPWQDKWTGTMAIDIKRSTNLSVPG